MWFLTVHQRNCRWSALLKGTSTRKSVSCHLSDFSQQVKKRLESERSQVSFLWFYFFCFNAATLNTDMYLIILFVFNDSKKITVCDWMEALCHVLFYPPDCSSCVMTEHTELIHNTILYGLVWGFWRLKWREEQESVGGRHKNGSDSECVCVRAWTCACGVCVCMLF